MNGRFAAIALTLALSVLIAAPATSASARLPRLLTADDSTAFAVSRRRSS